MGSLQPVNDSVYMASERRIDISPVTIYVSGVYACIAENIAGDEIAMFTIAVKGIQLKQFYTNRKCFCFIYNFAMFLHIL